MWLVVNLDFLPVPAGPQVVLEGEYFLREVLINGTSIFFLLFQTGGCFIQVILHTISTTGTRSSDRNKQEVAVFNMQ